MSIFSLRRTLAVARKEVRHLWRDPRMRPVMFVMPVMQLILLGLAANLDVQDVPVTVVDHDHSPLSREIIGRVDASPAFVVHTVTDDEARAERGLDDGTTEVVVVVPDGTQKALARGESAVVPVWLDGTDTNRALLAQGYLDAVLRRVSAERMPPTQALPLPGKPDVRVRVLFNPALQTRWFMLPAIVVMVLAVLTTLLSAMAVVKEREKGTIEQLVVTPIRSFELIVGKLVPFVGVGGIVATIVSLVAVFGFGIPFRGSPLDLAVMSLLFLMSTLGTGLLASTMSGTQQQAMLSTLLVLMPSFLIGGVFYPVTNMPRWAQLIADLTPVRYFVVMVRGVFIKGAGLQSLWWESSMLAAIGFVVLAVAVLRFRKRSA